MEIEESTFIEGSGGLPCSPNHSEAEKSTSKPSLPDKPITVQELGNMYAEWRMTDEFSATSEGWMPNQTILLIPAPKRPFNWKVGCSVLVIFAIGTISMLGIAYCVDYYTPFILTGGRRGMKGWKPKHEITTEQIKIDLKLDENLREAERAIKIVEENQRSREEMIRMSERVQQTLDMDPFFRSIQNYEELENRKREEDRKSQEKHQNLNDELRELFSRLKQRRRPEEV